MIEIEYKFLKDICKEKGLHVLESTYLGEGILGRFYEPDIILINIELCNGLDKRKFRKQNKILVLMHEICHWIKWQEHKKDHNKYDEEACFEFENICDLVLNEGYSLDKRYEAIDRLGLYDAMDFLKEVIRKGLR